MGNSMPHIIARDVARPKPPEDPQHRQHRVAGTGIDNTCPRQLATAATPAELSIRKGCQYLPIRRQARARRGHGYSRRHSRCRPPASMNEPPAREVMRNCNLNIRVQQTNSIGRDVGAPRMHCTAHGTTSRRKRSSTA